jgi:hypothetical protein
MASSQTSKTNGHLAYSMAYSLLRLGRREGHCYFCASLRDTGLLGGGQLSSPSWPSADRRLQVSWEDGDRVFCRGLRPDADGNSTAVLSVIPAAEHPSPAILTRLRVELLTTLTLMTDPAAESEPAPRSSKTQ